MIVSPEYIFIVSITICYGSKIILTNDVLIIQGDLLYSCDLVTTCKSLSVYWGTGDEQIR